MPVLGVIMNFCLVVGMDNSLEMRSARSAMVESMEKLKVCEVL